MQLDLSGGRSVLAQACYESSLSSADSVLESIPAVVAYLDLPILDAHGESVGRLVSWRGQGGAGADAKACAVTRANDLVAFDCAAGELPGIVGADVCDRVILAIEVENRDLHIVQVHDSPLARPELVFSRHCHPVAHALRKPEPSMIDVILQFRQVPRPRKLRCRARSTSPDSRCLGAFLRSNSDSCHTPPGNARQACCPRDRLRTGRRRRPANRDGCAHRAAR